MIARPVIRVPVVGMALLVVSVVAINTFAASGRWLVVNRGPLHLRLGTPPAPVVAVAQPAAQAQPVTPTTDRERFAVDLAAALGNAHPSPDVIAFLVAWQRGEGSASAFNPLATTQDWPGATIYNSVGVKNYASYQDGLQATVKTLGYGYDGYSDIVAGIQTNDPARALAGLYASPWGTSAGLVEQVYHELLATPARPAAARAPASHCPLAHCWISGSTFNAATHPGVDYGATLGEPVYATLSGRAQVSVTWPCGNGVEIFDGNRSVLTCHLSGFAVADGQQVQAGQQIGQAGSSGQSTGPHVHYEERIGGISQPVP